MVIVQMFRVSSHCYLLAFWVNLCVRPLTWSLADLASSWRLSYWSTITASFSISATRS